MTHKYMPCLNSISCRVPWSVKHRARSGDCICDIYMILIQMYGLNGRPNQDLYRSNRFFSQTTLSLIDEMLRAQNFRHIIRPIASSQLMTKLPLSWIIPFWQLQETHWMVDDALGAIRVVYITVELKLESLTSSTTRMVKVGPQSL